MRSKNVISSLEKINLPELSLKAVPARIDTGAQTSAIWAIGIKEINGTLHFKLFGKKSEHYSGKVLTTTHFEQRMITSSNGISEERYVIKLLIELAGRKIRASFSLANRSAQTYPVLVGRNVLRGKFLVDVQLAEIDNIDDRTTAQPSKVMRVKE